MAAMSDRRSKPYFFSFDTKSKPGKIIAHCIRVETVEIDDGPAFENTSFHLIDPDDDPRLKQLVELLKRK